MHWLLQLPSTKRVVPAALRSGTDGAAVGCSTNEVDAAGLVVCCRAFRHCRRIMYFAKHQCFLSNSLSCLLFQLRPTQLKTEHPSNKCNAAFSAPHIPHNSSSALPVTYLTYRRRFLSSVLARILKWRTNPKRSPQLHMQPALQLSNPLCPSRVRLQLPLHKRVLEKPPTTRRTTAPARRLRFYRSFNSVVRRCSGLQWCQSLQSRCMQVRP